MLGKEQSQTTKQVKGKDIIEFNQELFFTLSPTNIRSSQNGIKLCKLGRCNVELHSHGMLWGSTVIGTGDLKISPLQTKCESVQTVKIKNEEGVIIGELEVKLAVNRPFVTPETTDTTINLVKLEPVQLQPSPQLILHPVTTPTTTTKTAPAVTTTMPSTTPTTTSTSTAPTPPQPKEKDPDDMSSAEIIKASGFSKGLKVFESLSEFPPFVSMDTLTSEVEQCTAMLQSKQFKRRLDEYNCRQRISDANLRTTVLQTQVANEKLTLEQYLILVKEQIEYEALLEQETMKVAQWYKSKGKVDDARYYFELALWIKKRKEVTATELKNAEEGIEEE